MAIEVSKANFEQEVLQSKVPVVADFWAEWCGPCRMLAPVIEELSKEFQGKIKFVKINVDEEQELGSKFGIMSIPTLILFKDGKMADQSIGARPKDALKKWIQEKA